jgi:ubiquinone/menaquinone biosynthesis C-methylase UbiE
MGCAVLHIATANLYRMRASSAGPRHLAKRLAMAVHVTQSDHDVSDVKDQQTKHWDAVAAGWETWLDWTERNFAPVTRCLRDAAGWRPGARVLDVACGAGYPALAAARDVRPGGTVVGIDLSAGMVAAAARSAAAAGLDNVQFLEMDAEALRFADASFDAATNAYGLMFCPDLPRTLAEAHRVLKPGGHFAIAVWDEPSKSPFFSLIQGLAAARLSLAMPTSGAPGPFRLASAPALASQLTNAGFSAVRVDCCPAIFELASVDEYFQLFSDVAWKKRLQALPVEDVSRLRRDLAEAAQPFIVGGCLRLPAATLCASGVRALQSGP